MTTTELLKPDAEGLDRAATLLRAGKLVAFPTETVYGLGGDATQDQPLFAIYAAKNRPADNPLILHVASIGDARSIAMFDPQAEALASAFWPGPLTLVLPVRRDAGLSRLALGPDGRVALRVPENPLARSLIEAVGRPLAAPSANPSGRISPTSAAHVLAGLGGRIAAILDGGPCSVGLESTVVATGENPRLLRPGGIPKEEIEAAIGTPVGSATEDGRLLSPGQLPSHYAPRATVRLNARAAEGDEVLLGFGPTPGATLNLSPSGDLREAARNLFGHLHTLDGMDRPIAVAPIPETGVGAAINDRLRRAAAPRD